MKYMVMVNRQYMYGSAAPAQRPPERVQQIDKHLKDEEKKRKDAKRHALQRKNQLKMRTVVTIGGISVLLFLTMFRGTQVYEVQKEYVDLYRATHFLEKENEALSAEIIKISGIGDLVLRAEAMELIPASSVEGLELDLLAENFTAEPATAESAPRNPLDLVKLQFIQFGQ